MNYGYKEDCQHVFGELNATCASCGEYINVSTTLSDALDRVKVESDWAAAFKEDARKLLEQQDKLADLVGIKGKYTFHDLYERVKSFVDIINEQDKTFTATHYPRSK